MKYFVATLLLLAACGKQHVEPHYEELPKLPEIEVGELSAKKAFEVRSACEYWSSLTTPVATRTSTLRAAHDQVAVMQLFSDLRIARASNAELDIEGRQILAKLPQLQFFLSGEMVALEKKISTEGPLPTRLDASIDEFAQALQSSYDQERNQKKPIRQKSTDMLTAFFVRTFHDFYKKDGSFESLNEVIKNFGIQQGISGLVPGAFNSQVTSLESAQLFKEMLLAADLSQINSTEVDTLRLISREVPIFNSTQWSRRLQDLQYSFEALETPTDDANEKMCKFALGQRLMAQILTIKGMKAAPALTPQGLLSDLSKLRTQAYPQKDIAGDFGRHGESGFVGEVATLDWILYVLTKPGDPVLAQSWTQKLSQIEVRHAAKLSDFIDSIHYFVEFSSHRSDEIWQKYLKPDILNLALGLYAAEGTVLAEIKSKVDANNRFSFRDASEDTPDNLAKVLLLNLARVDAFESMETQPTELEQKLIKDSDRALITADLRLQLAGILLEARSRIRDGHYSQALLRAHDQIADRVGNPHLKTLTADKYHDLAP